MKLSEEYMLRVHEAVVVVKHAYPDQVPNEGEGLRRDRFYYGLTPSLRDALSFAMADLPEREQADTSFDTLYHLAKKLEVHDIICTAQQRGNRQLMTLIRVIGNTPPLWDVQQPLDQICFYQTLVQRKKLHLNLDHIEGLSLRMTHAMNLLSEART